MDNKSYQDLLKSVQHWNEYRVPILRISEPDKSLGFQGAMRFYFQDAGQKVATKCINVTSSDTTKDVIDVLIEKFRPDMRMLSVPEYGLYEIHENGDERKLELHERPIYVQLEWNKDDREGRFLLRRMDEKTRELAAQNEEPSLKRVLSKKEKKKQDKARKQQLKEQEKADAAASKLAAKNKNGIAERLYNELPETSFTRSISNPEAVMKRRRAQKLEKRLQEFSLEGGQDAGGTLRIFGEAINRDVSYKTLLLSTKDTAFSVVKQTLEKYGKEDEDPSNYCLIQLVVPPGAASAGGDNNSVHGLNTSSVLRESILEDNDCPLLINQIHDKSKGILTFHIRHKPADYHKRRKKKPIRAQAQQNPLHPLVVQQLNQRLQMNNQAEQYSNQNSPQNSSQTSSSTNQDMNHPPPPAFDSIHSMPNMYPISNGQNLMQPYQQPHSISTSTLPPRVNSQMINGHDFNGTLQRQNYSQPIMNNQQQQIAKQFMQSSLVPNPSTNNLMPISQQQPIQARPSFTHPTGANDRILPALIQVREDEENIFLNAVTTHIKPTDTSFRLAPTYVLYMVSRYRASTLFHPELYAHDRAELFVPFTRKIAGKISAAIAMHKNDHAALAFWLANSSDLCHFYKQDVHLSHFTLDAQEILHHCIKESFWRLLACKQRELGVVLDTFFDPNDQKDLQGDGSIAPVLEVFDDTMATMSKNRVNAALTIQIFSHLFHYISKWLFDRLIGVFDYADGMTNNQQTYSIYCNRTWGERLNRRLAIIGGWAEKQGLEQAADYHLARSLQVTLFYATQYPPNILPHHLKDACESCNRLNPVQMRAMLQRYQPESPVVRDIIDKLLFTMDYSYMATGEFPLEEDPELKIPFMIPDDGYSSEMIRYIPGGLLEFVSYLSKLRVGDRELCIFTVQPTSSGFWTVYFKNHQADAPDVNIIQLKKQNNSMGLSIIAARGVGQKHLGIYIKNVVKNGAAALDGQLSAGDQLLEVDGNSLLDISQEKAAELMQRTGETVTLKVAKKAALYHNLADVINSVPNQSIVSPQVPVQPSFDPPAPILSPLQQIPQPDRRMMQPHPHMQPVNSQSTLDRDNLQRHQLLNPPQEPQFDPGMVQFRNDRQISNFQDRLDMNNMQHQHSGAEKFEQQIVSDRQVHFQPRPMANAYDGQISPTLNAAASTASPLKSPKKVSWLDNQPHQSLHTLIPPSPSLVPSPTSQNQPSPPPPPPPPQTSDIEHMPNPFEDDTNNFMPTNHHYPINNNNIIINNNNGTHLIGSYKNGQNYTYLSDINERTDEGSDSDDDPDDDDNDDDDDDDDNGDNHIQHNDHQFHDAHRQTNGVSHQIIGDDRQRLGNSTVENNVSNDNNNSAQARVDNNAKVINGQLDAATESLTLEDIDEVLSSKTHNNWLEDSAGVIGTQEVYNDPRQRIVSARERPTADNVNIEKLSFQEKLKMFNISAKK